MPFFRFPFSDWYRRALGSITIAMGYRTAMRWPRNPWDGWFVVIVIERAIVIAITIVM
ncbi:hypothetical protein JCM14469_33010 [Desulfatiferula olefinivorans]